MKIKAYFISAALLAIGFSTAAQADNTTRVAATSALSNSLFDQV